MCIDVLLFPNVQVPIQALVPAERVPGREISVVVVGVVLTYVLIVPCARLSRTPNGIESCSDLRKL